MNNKEIVEEFYGQKIKDITLKDDVLSIVFPTLTLKIVDAGQCCCEKRYLHTDDTLDLLKGDTFTKIEELPTEYNIEWETNCEYRGGTAYHREHEIMFLRISTNQQTATIETHNKHNGYYSGFMLSASQR